MVIISWPWLNPQLLEDVGDIGCYNVKKFKS